MPIKQKTEYCSILIREVTMYKNIFKTRYNPSKKLWSGKDISPTSDLRTSLGQILFDALTENSNKIAQVDHKQIP